MVMMQAAYTCSTHNILERPRRSPLRASPPPPHPPRAPHQLHEDEVVVRNHELSGDRLLAEEELNRKMGTLRYLRQLRLARERAEARAAAAAAAAAAAGGGGGGTDDAAGGTSGTAGEQVQTPPAAPAAPDPCPCPVCHEEIAAACAVMPCGHQLCCGCTEALIARLPPGLAWPQRRVSCPTCRARHHTSDIAYVNEGSAALTSVTTTACAADAIAAAGGGGGGSSNGGAAAPAAHPAAHPAPAAAPTAPATPPGGWWSDEAGVKVSGSYGAKVEAVVRRVLHLLSADPSARILVFTQWADLLDILAHALRRNGVAPAQARGRQGFVRAVEEFKASAAADAAAAEAGGGSAEKEEEGEQQRVQVEQQAEGSDVQSQQQQQQQQLDTEQQQQQQQRQPGVAARLAQQQIAPKAVRVLLLLVSQGGMGLNLTEAAHVVMVEPLLDPALEVQVRRRV